jgi:transcriptional regulator with XRE-family HTH domain
VRFTRITGETMPKTLADDAADLRQRMSLVPPREEGAALRWQDKARIVALREQGKTQEEIAAEMGCHQSTVSRTLTDLDDSRPFARRLLDANAVTIVQDILDNLKSASMAEKTKILAKLDVIREEREAHATNGVQINIGMPGKPIALPVIETKAITSAEMSDDE